MRDNWRNKYSRLDEFIGRHSEIAISPELVRIPDNIRAEFYGRFDDVRGTFIEQFLPMCLENALNLNHNIKQAEQEATAQLALEKIQYPDILERFVHDPLDSLMREAFDPLFDLLKGLLDYESFEQKAPQRIGSWYTELYPQGFEKWLALSLIPLLGAKEVFQFEEREVSLYDEHRAQGVVMEEIPVPKLSREVLFRDCPDAAFTLPDYIVYAAPLKKYISLRASIGTALAGAFSNSAQRQWLNIEAMPNVWGASHLRGATLIYAAEQPEDITLVADKKSASRPELIVESVAFSQQLTDDMLDKIILRHNTLKPSLGTFILSLDAPQPESWSDRIGAVQDIRFIESHFEKSKLSPIVSALMK